MGWVRGLRLLSPDAHVTVPLNQINNGVFHPVRYVEADKIRPHTKYS